VVTNANVAHISLLATEFSFGELRAECAAFSRDSFSEVGDRTLMLEELLCSQQRQIETLSTPIASSQSGISRLRLFAETNFETVESESETKNEKTAGFLYRASRIVVQNRGCGSGKRSGHQSKIPVKCLFSLRTETERLFVVIAKEPGPLSDVGDTSVPSSPSSPDKADFPMKEKQSVDGIIA
jgi:hypothetical protein